MKKVFATAIFLISIFLPTHLLAQEQSQVNVYMFWSEGCPHCHKEIEFLSDLVKEKPNVNVEAFEVSKSFKNASLFAEVGKYLGADTRGVPFTVIGSQTFSGFGSAETTGVAFRDAIEKVEKGEDEDILSDLFEEDDIGEDQRPVQEDSEEQTKRELIIPEELDLPILGDTDPKSLSLPALTFFIALVDGFNPCAMWVLLFLISLLLGFKDRRRMWILGLTFIAASAFVYFLFMAAWLNFFLFFGFIIWIRIIVGAVALIFAYKSIRSFVQDRDGGCEVTKDEKRVETLQKIKTIAQKKNLLPAMGGIILLAFAINLIEAVCSAGLPAIYTQILTMNDLSKTQYYMYIIFYQIVFMLDDMLVFIIAMVTLRSVGIESKYARWTKLIGGLVMLVIGLLLLFKPEWLLFG